MSIIQKECSTLLLGAYAGTSFSYMAHPASLTIFILQILSHKFRQRRAVYIISSIYSGYQL